MAFAANHFSTSDRSQPPEICFAGNSPFLHQRKSVERLTPTTRTTSLVLMRASMPANRSKMGGRFGLLATEIFGLFTGGMTSTSGSCTGRSPRTAFRRLEIATLGRWRPGVRCISRGPETVLLGPLATATEAGDGRDVLIAQAVNRGAGAVTGPDHHLASLRGVSLAVICANCSRSACCRGGG